jgi:hypothetical protein
MSRFDVKKINSNIGVAWQYKRRIEAANLECNNEYWKDLDINLSNSIVKEMSIVEARPIIEKYEWLGTMAAVNKHAYGIYF